MHSIEAGRPLDKAGLASRCRIARREVQRSQETPRLLHFKPSGIRKAPFNGQTELFQAVAFLSTGPASSPEDKYSCTGPLL